MFPKLIEKKKKKKKKRKRKKAQLTFLFSTRKRANGNITTALVYAESEKTATSSNISKERKVMPSTEINLHLKELEESCSPSLWDVNIMQMRYAPYLL